MIIIFILITLAMTVPVLSEGAEQQPIERRPAMTHEYEEYLYPKWSERDLRSQKIDQYRHEVMRKKAWKDRQAAREEYLAQREERENERAKALSEHLAKIQESRSNRSPASAEVMNDRYQYRKQYYERYVASVKERRKYLRELRKHESVKDRYENTRIDRRIDELEKENERD